VSQATRGPKYHQTASKDLLLWRRLTKTDFSAMNGQAAPHGRGGGAMHIALGVQTSAFPVQEFLRTRKTQVTIKTEPWAERHVSATLTFSGNPGRRGGEWRISDQYTHRHPAWTEAAGFPQEYDPSNPPYVLVFRVQDQYHARLSTGAELLALGPDTPRRLRSDLKGISIVTPGLLSHFGVPAKTLLESFEEQQAQPLDAFNPKDVEDARQRIFAAILRRQGQQAFRRKLLKAYRNKCAITGNEILWVLEAAHITPYRGAKTNTLANGLVLRADIHTLFDLGLISVDPAALTVKISSLLHGTEYAALEGSPLAIPAKPSARPSKAALQEHYSTFRQ
jgi:hypothetical protein